MRENRLIAADYSCIIMFIGDVNVSVSLSLTALAAITFVIHSGATNLLRHLIIYTIYISIIFNITSCTYIVSDRSLKHRQ